MKRLIITFVILATILFCPTPTNAYSASTTFAQATTKTAYFFSEKDVSKSLFAVPYTYCVQVLSEDGEWYYCKYADDLGSYRSLYGYCLKSDFVAVDELPERPYLYKNVNVTYHPDLSDASLPVVGNMTVQASFYGTYYAGKTAYSYVLCGDSFGYILGANDDYPLNEIAVAKPKTEQAAKPKDNFATAVVLLSFAVAIILYLIATAKPKRHDLK